jgi:DNA modification methylase
MNQRFKAKGIKGNATSLTGLSVFDPVLCELVYRWFAPTGGVVVDPFAGGSVRGIVATEMGLRYWGSELREEQVLANRMQADDICAPDPIWPMWVPGDALSLLTQAPTADLVFTCPPYANLERYSDDPRDLSTMEYHTFLPELERILLRAVGRLHDNRFLVLVVSNFRGSDGAYRPLVADSIIMCQKMGLMFYNDIVLAQQLGNAGMRATKQFTASRKVVRVHESVLVFVRGSWRSAAAVCKKIDEAA